MLLHYYTPEGDKKTIDNVNNVVSLFGFLITLIIVLQRLYSLT